MTDGSPGPNVSPDEVDQLYRNSKELEKSEDSPPAPLTAPIALSSDVPGANLLNGLVNAAPFSEFLHFKARANCTHKTDQGRIRKYSEEHPNLAKFCLVADVIFRVLVVLAVLAVVGAVLAGVILKTFYR
ncbi:hypothetical protein CIW49_18625 [Mycolicibacterium sp. P1-18]|uniref:hypothetical protein n=1 Tax=Mycolicibacterium sp. P1-18 TaxID=2024615 RepID=UPI0011F38A4E|nr:hypothetical protein [Mycolicibacterium sp. P1-18]KAA0096686.1 hypothetical protein CIW49_18625 [Mycolicibacterium sp. P1-18]